MSKRVKKVGKGKFGTDKGGIRYKRGGLRQKNLVKLCVWDGTSGNIMCLGRNNGI